MLDNLEKSGKVWKSLEKSGNREEGLPPSLDSEASRVEKVGEGWRRLEKVGEGSRDLLCPLLGSLDVLQIPGAVRGAVHRIPEDSRDLRRSGETPIRSRDVRGRLQSSNLANWLRFTTFYYMSLHFVTFH